MTLPFLQFTAEPNIPLKLY